MNRDIYVAVVASAADWVIAVVLRETIPFAIKNARFEWVHFRGGLGGCPLKIGYA